MVRIHSPRPEILLHFKQILRLENLVSNRRFAIVPSFVPTPDHVLRGLYRFGCGRCRLRAGLAVARAFDGFLDRLHLRVDVTPRGREIAVPGEVAQGVRVHVRRPSREAGVAEGVERELRDLG